MKLLLDTHALIWMYEGDARLSAPALAAINDPANSKFVSIATYWEIAIKLGTGKLRLTKPYDEFMRAAVEENGFVVLPIEPWHTSAVVSLANHHRDPFDRMLAVQSLIEGLTFVSTDAIFDAYGVPRLW